MTPLSPLMSALPARPPVQAAAVPVASTPVVSIPEPAAPADDPVAQARKEAEMDVGYQLLKRMFGKTTEQAAPADEGASPAQTQMSVVETPNTQSAAAPASLELSLSWQQHTEMRVQVSTADGTQLSIQLSQRAQGQLLMRWGEEPPPQQADPLVLDLGGQGITTTGIAQGTLFDMTGDGRTEQVSFVRGDSWFLALDRNGNGLIDDGRELFGDQHGAANGFEELARFDDNRDGLIDANDAVFSQLLLFSLAEDGSQRTKTLEDAGVRAIHLDYRHTQKWLNAYDQVAQMGQFERDDGSLGTAADVLLGYRTA